MTCSMLAPNGRCTVYSLRPLVCRMWGVVRAMPCPWGCEPERWLTDREAMKLMAAAAELSGEDIGNLGAEMIDSLPEELMQGIHEYVAQGERNRKQFLHAIDQPTEVIRKG